MSAEATLHASIKAFLDKNYPCCGVPGCCGEEEEAWAILDIVKAAGFGLVSDAKSEARREAALELMDVTENDSRMPGIRFAVGFLAGQRQP